MRQEKQRIREELRKQRASPRSNHLRNFERIAALEQELKEEWKKKENSRLIGVKTKEIDKLQEKQLIQKKIRLETEKQEDKLFRQARPEGPKAPTLPYLKEAKTKLIKSVEDETPEVPEPVEANTVGRPPMLMYVPGGNFKLSSHHSNSPVNRRKFS